MKPIEEYVRSIPDFPEPGIIFRDVTSILQDADGLQLAIDLMQENLKDVDFDVIAGPNPEDLSLVCRLHIICTNHLYRSVKKENFRARLFLLSYDLEYGRATIEMHKDSIKPGQKVVIIDDLIATGGTIEAAIKLIEALAAK